MLWPFIYHLCTVAPYSKHINNRIRVCVCMSKMDGFDYEHGRLLCIMGSCLILYGHRMPAVTSYVLNVFNFLFACTFALPLLSQCYTGNGHASALASDIGQAPLLHSTYTYNKLFTHLTGMLKYSTSILQDLHYIPVSIERKKQLYSMWIKGIDQCEW